jgi:predicted dehydrogenase
MSKYTVAIIGCGSIGALKDNAYDSPTTEAILTHAHAFHRHLDTEIIAFLDSDYSKAKQAMTKWDNGHCAPDTGITDFGLSIPIDIIVVASPTETHWSQLLQVLALKPRLVIAEKPFCSSLKEAQEVHDAYANAGIPIVVDYIRMFDPVAAGIFDGLRDGRFGQVYHARCLYGRGLRRDGCHALAVYNHIFGAINGLSYSHAGIVDHLRDDPSYTLRLEYERCAEAYMVGTDSRKWGAFEMDFATEAGIISFVDWGKTVRIRKPEQESTFGQYQSISPRCETIQTGLNKALLYMVDNAVKYLRDKTPLLCTSLDAIKVHSILSQISGEK